jgi:hypothetical protein
MEKPRKKRIKRPPAVTLIAWVIFILFLVRLYQVFTPLIETDIFLNGINSPLFEGIQPTLFGNTILTSGAYLFLSLAGIVVLIGFLRMKRWSWIVLMAWTCMSLAVTLIAYFYNQTNYIVMASDTIIAFALSQADVQRVFGIRTDIGENLN